MILCRTIDESSGVDMGLVTRYRATTVEGAEGIVSTEDQRDLDEPCTGLDCDSLQFIDEFHSGEKLRDDDVVTSIQMGARHRQRQGAGSAASVARLVQPAAQQAAHDVDVEVQRERSILDQAPCQCRLARRRWPVEQDENWHEDDRRASSNVDVGGGAGRDASDSSDGRGREDADPVQRRPTASRAMTTDVVPILRVADAAVAAAWYARLGFTVEFVHRFEPHLPAYVGIRREGAQIHLSEHAGDARPHTLVYIWVDAVDAVAAEFDATVDEAPWAREVSLTDPDHNRLRIAEPVPAPGVERRLGEGVEDELLALEAAMWNDTTRGDRGWMGEHLADDFIEHGYSGRIYDREAILDAEVGPITATLIDLAVRPLGRDAALVTYRSNDHRGFANRASVWKRDGGVWRLAFHDGTPAE